MEREEQTIQNVVKRVSNGNGTNGHRAVIKNQTIAAKQEADEIVAQARLEAETIIKNALTKSEEVLDDAYREGLEKALAEFEQHLIDVKEIRSKVLRDAERDLLTLSVRIACVQGRASV